MQNTELQGPGCPKTASWRHLKCCLMLTDKIWVGLKSCPVGLAKPCAMRNALPLKIGVQRGFFPPDSPHRGPAKWPFIMSFSQRANGTKPLHEPAAFLEYPSFPLPTLCSNSALQHERTVTEHSNNPLKPFLPANSTSLKTAQIVTEGSSMYL